MSPPRAGGPCGTRSPRGRRGTWSSSARTRRRVGRTGARKRAEATKMLPHMPAYAAESDARATQVCRHPGLDAQAHALQHLPHMPSMCGTQSTIQSRARGPSMCRTVNQSEGAERSFTVPGCVAKVGFRVADSCCLLLFPPLRRTLYFLSIEVPLPGLAPCLLSGKVVGLQIGSLAPGLQHQRLTPDTSSQIIEESRSRW